ncbi:MAG: family 43 glycosylhydrolase [Prevotellaceae bacterium]|nr:family 43 glycosylhydrolase [Prevotellaceae bacterium]
MKRLLTFLLISYLCSAAGFSQSKDSLIEVTSAQISTAYKKVTKRSVSVHDPSIVRNPADGKYYVYGSHLAAGVSSDGMNNWTSTKFTFNSSTPYRQNAVTKVKILSGNDTVLTDFGTYNAEQWRYTAANPNISGNQWAPDIIWNPNLKKWCLYMSLNGNDWRCSIVLLTSDNIAGPFTYQGPVVFSGFQWSDLSSQTWKETDIRLVPGLQDITTLPARYNIGSEWGKRWPNCIDPCVFFDDNGELWMSYGSWSGGIFLLKLDKNTGLRDYTHKYNIVGTGNAATEDPYFGKKIAGGYYVSGEGSYIEKIGDWYYLFISYGGLESNAGYEMRYYRSSTPEGPYTDRAGNSPIFTSYKMNYGPNAASNAGTRLFGSYKWDVMSDAELAQGHCSALSDTDGRAYLVYHTRFANGGEGHQVRVHQLFQDTQGWLVAAPYEFTGCEYNQDSIESRRICSTYDIVGTYKVIMHPYKLDYANKAYQKEQQIYMHENGTVTGDYTGTWSIPEQGKSYFRIAITPKKTSSPTTYIGVILPQNISGTNINAVCFMAHSSTGVAIWGSNADGKGAVAHNYTNLRNSMPVKVGTVTQDLDLTSMPSGLLYGTTLTSYSENPSIISDDGRLQVTTTSDTSVTPTLVKYVFRYTKDNYFFDQKVALQLRIADKKGDANADGSIDVADISTLASYILGYPTEHFSPYSADANSDGAIDITDITATAAIILGR